MSNGVSKKQPANGLIETIGLSRRSTAGLGAMGMILKLVSVDAEQQLLAIVAMGLIAFLAAGYMIADEIKGRRKAKP